MNATHELTVSRIIPAPPERVCAAWLDPAALARFIKPMDDMPDCEVELDPREGGEFVFVMRAGEKKMPHRGIYTTIRSPEELVFTWRSEHAGEGSVVTITFAPHGDGATELTLHHAGLDDAAIRDSHEGGWTRIVERLAEHLA